MADTFLITPYVVRSAGTDVPPEEVQAAVNSLARQTTVALNSVASDPTGPAGGDLGGTYPNPTVVNLHVTGGTLDGVVIGGTTPAAATVTTLTATTPVAVTSGGTGQNALNAHNVILGEGSSAVGFAAPGAAGQMLISAGAAVDPAFGGAPTITGGSVNGAPVGNITPSTGAFTTLSASSGLNSTAVGNTTPSTGAFTTLSASSTVSGAGFTTFFASPPPIGTTAANTGTFTTLSASSTVSGTGFVNRFASPGPIGNTAASTGAFTTLTASGTITPSSTAGIVGTTTNDNANAGSVGELLTNSASGVSATNNTGFNATSLNITAGDWEVYGAIEYVAGSGTTTLTSSNISLNTTSATLGAFPNTVRNQASTVVGTAAGQDITIGPLRFSLAGTATVFLVGVAVFAAGTTTASGFIKARRVR